MTLLGQLPFFIDFLKTGGLFDAFVADCPLRYVSPNAPGKRDVLGTAMLSMLAGHRRYAHMRAALRRGAAGTPGDEEDRQRGRNAAGLQGGRRDGRGRLAAGTSGILRGAAAGRAVDLDVDTTIKPLYGHQEGADLGYKPKKPGRPSHCYHTYAMASTRLILDADVCPGDEHTSKHGAPGLWGLIDRCRATCGRLCSGRPGLRHRGDHAGGGGAGATVSLQTAADRERQADDREARLGARMDRRRPGFGVEDRGGRLEGWSRERRTIVFRRRLKGAVGLREKDDGGTPQLAFVEIGEATEVYEYSVLVTSLDEETEAFGQLYRDRGDGENIFDEMKNQWGWGGYTTHDLARCRLAARLLALFYNW